MRVPFGVTPTVRRLPEFGSSEVYAIPWRSAWLTLPQPAPTDGDPGVVATTQRSATPGTSQYVPGRETGIRRARLQRIPGTGSLKVRLTVGGMPSAGVRSSANLADSRCDMGPLGAAGRRVSGEVPGVRVGACPLCAC